MMAGWKNVLLKSIVFMKSILEKYWDYSSESMLICQKKKALLKNNIQKMLDKDKHWLLGRKGNPTTLLSAKKKQKIWL